MTVAERIRTIEQVAEGIRKADLSTPYSYNLSIIVAEFALRYAKMIPVSPKGCDEEAR